MNSFEFLSQQEKEDASVDRENKIHFQSYLLKEFQNRLQKNKSYSLRSFAKSLDINHGVLSQILRGKRLITPAIIVNLGRKLNLSEDIINYYINALNLKNQNEKQLTRLDESEYSIDTFDTLNKWYHFVLFPLLSIEQYYFTDFDFIVLGEKLQVSPPLIKRALIELKSFSMINYEDLGKIKVISQAFKTTKNISYTKDALKKIQNDFLDLAINSLWQDDLDVRDHSSVTIKVDTTLIPLLKDLIRNFKQKYVSIIEKQNELNATKVVKRPKQEVYQLNICFFPIGKIKK